MKVLGLTISKKKFREISRQAARFVRVNERKSLKLGRELVGRTRRLGDHVREVAGFVASLPDTYMGTAAYQVRATSDGWIITERGSTIPLHIFARKLQAIREATKMARDHKAHLDIFSKHGSLQTHRSFA